MKNNDTLSLDQLRQQLQQLQQNIKDGDSEAFAATFGQLTQKIQENLMEEVQAKMDEAAQRGDNSVRMARGANVLTHEEREYYQKLIGAMSDKNPRQALNNLDLVMPETVIERVFESLRTEHPLHHQGLRQRLPHGQQRVPVPGHLRVGGEHLEGGTGGRAHQIH